MIGYTLIDAITVRVEIKRDYRHLRIRVGDDCFIYVAPTCGSIGMWRLLSLIEQHHNLSSLPLRNILSALCTIRHSTRDIGILILSHPQKPLGIHFQGNQIAQLAMICVTIYRLY